MDPQEIQSLISGRMQSIASRASIMHGDLIASSSAAYEQRWGESMPEAKKMVLMNSMNVMTDILVRKGVPKEAIMSATVDIHNVDNPLSMLFNLMSILIPNFAYVEAVGVQPMPTKESPIFFPQLTAVDARNGVAASTSLLGSTHWATSNKYTGNQMADVDLVLTNGLTTCTGTLDETDALPGTVEIVFTLSGVQYFVVDDGVGAFPATADCITGGTINYSTGAISCTLTAGATIPGDTATADGRYDLNTKDPAQALFEWASIPVTAQPRRLRSTYSLDNFYQAKQVLKGYNIDEVMSSAIAGYINKEISGGVFDNMLDQVDADYTWDKTPDTGVSWALHRLSLLQTYVEAANALRQNVSRSGGNIVVAGTTHMNYIETFGDDVYKPESYSAEPIGPYVAGRLMDRFKIIKNQDYPDVKATMAYKKDETDASYAVGVFIGLYATDPLAKDDLNVVQGMGTQIGETKVFDNSLVSLTVTAS